MQTIFSDFLLLFCYFPLPDMLNVYLFSFLIAARRIPLSVLILSLKSSTLSSSSFRKDNTFWGVGSVAVKQSRLKANMMSETGNSAPPADPPNQECRIFFAIFCDTDILGLIRIK